MKHFTNIKDNSIKDLRKILNEAKKRKFKRKKLKTLEVDRDQPLKGNLLIQNHIQKITGSILSLQLYT